MRDIAAYKKTTGKANASSSGTKREAIVRAAHTSGS